MARSRTLLARNRLIARLRAMRTSHPAGDPSAFVGVRPRPGGQEHLLQDVLGLAPVFQDAQDETEQKAAVPVVELGNRARISGDNSIDERYVGACLLGDLSTSVATAGFYHIPDCAGRHVRGKI